MAFDINVLNGMQFTADQIGFVPGVNERHATGGLTRDQGWAINDPRMQFDGSVPKGVPVIYGSADAKTDFQQLGSSDITIGAVYNYYYPSYTDANGYYRLPNFGVFNIGSESYTIVGFGEDGRSMLVSRSFSSNIKTLNLTDIQGAYIFSLDALPIYTYNNPPAGTPYQFGSDQANIDTFTAGLAAICFAEGTRIATERGTVAVEDLVEGDRALTASGEARPVKWIGQMLSRPASHPRPQEVNPVRISAHAFAPDCPMRDVRLSPGHAILIDGVLVPVGHLVNGATIVQEAVEQIRYFHVELDSHDVLLAEGLPCESYFDDGNRRSFANGGRSVELHGRLDPRNWDDACAPMVAAGPQLVELQRRLHVRAAELGWVKQEEPALRLIVEGAEITPQRVEAGRYWFEIPAAKGLTLRSNAAVLGQMMPGIADGRCLGVAIAEISIDGAVLDLNSAALGRGFHPAEGHGWRWTDGNAELVYPMEGPVVVEIVLAMVAPNWKRGVASVPAVA